MAECRVGPRDGCAVRTRALAGVVREWVDRWDRDHPDLAAGKRRISHRGVERGEQIGAIGALTILHERTVQSDPVGLGVSKDRIRRVLDDRATDYTELRTADILVAAIERPEVFHDGTLPIEPNPLAARSARASCCGGSLNGAVSPATG